MAKSTTNRETVTAFLVDFAQSETKRAAKIHPNYARLWEEITKQLASGGKRLRPHLAMLSYEAFGGREHEAMIQVAAAWELLHTSMLMHDDIIDRDYKRHGRPNLAGEYLSHYAFVADTRERHHYADAAALLGGNALISASYRLIFDSLFAPELKQDVLGLLYEALFTVSAGELLDVEASSGAADVDPLTIARYKTANYSLIGPLLAGATLANAPIAAKAELRKLGTLLGVGYQMVDDLLGTFGDEAQTGKSTTSDLEEGKRTFLLVEALRLLPVSDRIRAEVLLSSSDPGRVDELRELLIKSNVKAVLLQKIESLKLASLDIVENLPINDPHKQNFTQIVAMLLERQA